MVEVGQVGRAADESGQSAFYLHFQRGSPFGAAHDLVKSFLRAGDDKVSQPELHCATSSCKSALYINAECLPDHNHPSDHACCFIRSWSAGFYKFCAPDLP